MRSTGFSRRGAFAQCGAFAARGFCAMRGFLRNLLDTSPICVYTERRKSRTKRRVFRGSLHLAFRQDRPCFLKEPPVKFAEAAAALLAGSAALLAGSAAVSAAVFLPAESLGASARMFSSGAHFGLPYQNRFGRDAEMRYAIGIDLGGTNIAVGIVTQEHVLLDRDSTPTLARRPWQEVAADMARLALALVERNGLARTDCAGVGIGSPGICNGRTGEVVYSNNLHWERVPLCAAITQQTGFACRLSNDANCAALGEVAAGAAKGCKNAVLLTLGTGVGGGVIIDGSIYEGQDSAGAELGHTTLISGGVECTCGPSREHFERWPHLCAQRIRGHARGRRRCQSRCGTVRRISGRGDHKFCKHLSPGSTAAGRRHLGRGQNPHRTDERICKGPLLWRRQKLCYTRRESDAG